MLAPISLDDKYHRLDGRISITGSQALLRAAMLQRRRDQAVGLRTEGFISGYRGSPMHNLDKELWAANRLLPGAGIQFWPAINEDLAATAIWGTQQVGAFGDATCDGVFSMWYGKGPGLDRSVDAIRHAHLAGSAVHGGVLVVVGDDHPLSSTDATAAHETLFADMLMPVLYPANVQEIIDHALLGWAMSRYSGGWVGFKLIPDTVDAAATVDGDAARPAILLPDDDVLPPDGLNLRVPDSWMLQEPRLRAHKLDAALAFARVNGLNRVTLKSRKPRYGIIATGKAWTDVRQALFELGLGDDEAAALGITVLKLGMPYPANAEDLQDFAGGLEEVLVVEEKHRLVEGQLKDALYALPDAERPRVVGRDDESGAPLLPAFPEYTPEDVTRALARRIAPFHTTERITARLAFLDARAEAAVHRKRLSLMRRPYFCSGCPHNTSTRIPEGSRAHGGVGCHYMATYMDRGNMTHCHMGGEGLTWVGQAPFVKTEHVFQNLGDGTYYHSGYLAIRACVAAGVNITFKILFNDAVAMTGGQPVDGPLTVVGIARQVAAEGVSRVVVVSDEPDKYPIGTEFPADMRIEHRRSLDKVQRNLREIGGVSVLIYDQTCAAEKRRRRKRGRIGDPSRRVFINARVCEGCGDCNVKSNCMSVLPANTPFGRKRRIDQSACNKDYSCAEGFCPSFVSIIGGRPRRAATGVEPPSHLVDLPESTLTPLATDRPFNLLVAGVGGTGVVTIGAILTMGAHIEGKAFSTVDQFGMAQKGGAVTSHIRIAETADAICAVRLNAGAADLVLGCDSLVTGDELALSVMAPGKTHVLVNTHEQITGDFTRNPDLTFPTESLAKRIAVAAGNKVVFHNVSRLATRLLGDSIGSNLMLLGVACQMGLLPVGAQAIEAAIEMNGVAVQMNRDAFVWGRRLALDPEAVTALVEDEPEASPDWHAELTAYQDAELADRHAALVEKVRAAETQKAPGQSGLADTVARNAYALMAYKDEYEVARLHSDPAFLARLYETFEGDTRLAFHLAPPLLTSRDPDTRRPRKMTFGSWVLPIFRILARLKGLRGTAFDPFGYTAERRRERVAIGRYETTVQTLLDGLTPDSHALAVEIASLPSEIRGYGHVKEEARAAAQAREAELLGAYRDPGKRAVAAE